MRKNKNDLSEKGGIGAVMTMLDDEMLPNWGENSHETQTLHRPFLFHLESFRLGIINFPFAKVKWGTGVHDTVLIGDFRSPQRLFWVVREWEGRVTQKMSLEGDSASSSKFALIAFKGSFEWNYCHHDSFLAGESSFCSATDYHSRRKCSWSRGWG